MLRNIAAVWTPLVSRGETRPSLFPSTLKYTSCKNMWPNDKILQLIEDYQASYCLWDVTSLDYKNRRKRNVALESLAAKHGVTMAEIKKKIHNLKTSFHRERRKNPPKNGNSPKKSMWFAYEYLQFLLPANESKGSRNTDLDDTQTGNNGDEDSSMDAGDNQDQEEALNVDGEREDERQSFKTLSHSKRYPPKRVRKNGDSPGQQAVNCMQSLSEIVTTRDENSVFGEYVANKMRNCNRPRAEVSLAQHFINDVLFRLDMGLLASEILSIQTPHTHSASILSITSQSPSSYVSQDSYSSNPSKPTTNGIEEVGDDNSCQSRG